MDEDLHVLVLVLDEFPEAAINDVVERDSSGDELLRLDLPVTKQPDRRLVVVAVLGWAGWDHAEQSLALSRIIGEREQALGMLGDGRQATGPGPRGCVWWAGSRVQGRW